MTDSLEILIWPAAYGNTQLILVAVVVLMAGFLRGFVGFGSSLVIVMVLSMVLGPHAAVPIASLSGLPVMLQLLPTAIRHAERPFVIPFGLATFVAAPLGTWILISLDPAIMKMAISTFVLAMAVMLYRGWRLTRRPSRAMLLGAGIGAGLVQGSAGVGGPPAVVIALSRPGAPQQQRANVIGAVSALSLCSVPSLWYYGLYTREVIVISLVLFPFYAGTTWLGARFFSGRGHGHFRNAALLTLAVASLVTLSLAIRDYVTV